MTGPGMGLGESFYFGLRPTTAIRSCRPRADTSSSPRARVWKVGSVLPGWALRTGVIRTGPIAPGAE